jgi:hypothetical protein
MPRWALLQVFAQAAFQGAVVDPAVGLGHADAFGKHLQRGGGVATAAQADDGGHARVVPAADLVVVHQLGQLALAGDDVGEVQARKFVLAGGRAGQQAAFGQGAPAASRKTGAGLQTPACTGCG